MKYGITIKHIKVHSADLCNKTLSEWKKNVTCETDLTNANENSAHDTVL